MVHASPIAGRGSRRLRLLRQKFFAAARQADNATRDDAPRRLNGVSLCQSEEADLGWR